MTDAHFADTATRGTQYYRESVAKMTECVTLMNDRKVDFLIETGDIKDEDQPSSEKNSLKYLETIEKVFARFQGKRYHVLGNHDLDSISKPQFLARTENTGIVRGATYYSFDLKGLHFIVLDANYTADGSDYDHGHFHWNDINIPRKELIWLENDLASTPKPVIVFVHQPLDSDNAIGISNAASVRRVLEHRGTVLAVFQGHYHPGSYRCINGIHYYTLKAMVEGDGTGNNAYAIVDVAADHGIVVTGYRRAVSQKMKPAFQADCIC